MTDKKWLGLDQKKLAVSVFAGDEENDSIDMVTDESEAKISNRQRITEDNWNDNQVYSANGVLADANTGGNTTSSGEGLQMSGISTGAPTARTSIVNTFNRISETFSRIVR